MNENHLDGVAASSLTSSEVFRTLAENLGYVVKSFDTLPSGDIVAEGVYLWAQDFEGNLKGTFVDAKLAPKTYELHEGVAGNGDREYLVVAVNVFGRWVYTHHFKNKAEALAWMKYCG